MRRIVIRYADDDRLHPRESCADRGAEKFSTFVGALQIVHLAGSSRFDPRGEARFFFGALFGRGIGNKRDSAEREAGLLREFPDVALRQRWHIAPELFGSGAGLKIL